jgi:hypothetical protein
MSAVAPVPGAPPALRPNGNDFNLNALGYGNASVAAPRMGFSLPSLKRANGTLFGYKNPAKHACIDVLNAIAKKEWRNYDKMMRRGVAAIKYLQSQKEYNVRNPVYMKILQAYLPMLKLIIEQGQVGKEMSGDFVPAVHKFFVKNAALRTEFDYLLKTQFLENGDMQKLDVLLNSAHKSISEFIESQIERAQQTGKFIGSSENFHKFSDFADAEEEKLDRRISAYPANAPGKLWGTRKYGVNRRGASLRSLPGMPKSGGKTRRGGAPARRANATRRR